MSAAPARTSSSSACTTSTSPTAQVHRAIVRSNGFTADHMSVYDLSAAAKRGIWARADQLIADAISKRPTD